MQKQQAALCFSFKCDIFQNSMRFYLIQIVSSPRSWQLQLFSIEKGFLHMVEIWKRKMDVSKQTI